MIALDSEAFKTAAISNTGRAFQEEFQDERGVSQ
jgi:hypothetical protein